MFLPAPLIKFTACIYSEFAFGCIAYKDLLCGLVLRVPGYRFRGPGSIPGAKIGLLFVKTLTGDENC
jgi:hypothetical protein